MNHKVRDEQCDVWKDPPPRFRPLQIVHHHTPSTTADICEYLDKGKQMGLGGFVINVDANPGSADPYGRYLRDEEEWQRMKLFVTLAQEQGFVIWIYDEKGYPSGSAGSLVIEGNPEYQVKGVIGQIQDLGHSRQGTLTLDDGVLLSVAAYEKSGSDVTRRIALDHMVQGKQVAYDLPHGEWIIVACLAKDIRWICESGKPFVDLLNPQVVRKFIELTHERYNSRFGSAIMSKIEAVFTDEPGIPVHGCSRIFDERYPVIPWTNDLAAKFAEMYGYELQGSIDKIFLNVGEASYPVRRDYWRLVSRLLQESFFQQISDWCQEHNTAFTGHIYGEESLASQIGLAGDMFGCLRPMQMPGVDRLYCTNPRDVVPEKTASSAAHSCARQQVMSESSEHYERVRWQTEVDVFDMINSGTYQVTLGVTNIACYYPMRLLSVEDRAFYQLYMGRLVGMLAEAKHVAQVLVHIPLVGAWERYQPQSQKCWQVGPGHISPGQPQALQELEDRYGQLLATLMDSQWDFDLIDDRQLASCEMDGHGKITTGHEQFQTLVVFDTGYLEPEVAQTLQRFVAGGAMVVIVKDPAKELSPWYQQHQAHFVVAESAHEVAVALQSHCVKDFRLIPDDPQIWYLHKQRHDCHIYLIYNRENRTKSVAFELQVTGPTDIYYPLTGRIEPMAAEQHLSVDLPPRAGVFCVVKNSEV